MILDDILARRHLRVAEDKRRVDPSTMSAHADRAPAPPSFLEAVRARRGEEIRLIAEIKRASPSAGALNATLDPRHLAGTYRDAGAHALSVLTEPDFFQGSLDDLDQARAARLPILRKDFVFDPYQIDEARAVGASAVLLIVAMLDDDALRALHEHARARSLTALVEVHDEHELVRALAISPALVGVNNRDLKTFTIDLERCLGLRPRVPDDVLFVAESGIATRDHVTQLVDAGCDAMLIGTSLVRDGDPGARVRSLLMDV